MAVQNKKPYPAQQQEADAKKTVPAPAVQKISSAADASAVEEKAANAAQPAPVDGGFENKRGSFLIELSVVSGSRSYKTLAVLMAIVVVVVGLVLIVAGELIMETGAIVLGAVAIVAVAAVIVVSKILKSRTPFKVISKDKNAQKTRALVKRCEAIREIRSAQGPMAIYAVKVGSFIRRELTAYSVGRAYEEGEEVVIKYLPHKTQYGYCLLVDDK